MDMRNDVVTWFWLELLTGWMGVSSCPKRRTAMLRPYKNVGILMFHFRYINILNLTFDISKINGAG
jgi:hypothetical protein